MRTIFRLKRLESCRSTFKYHNILTVPGLYIQKISIMIYKGEIILRQPSHHYKTRNRNLYFSNQTRLHLHTVSIDNMAAQIKNKIPPEILNQPTLAKFKKNLNDWLLSEPYYSVDEFLQTSPQLPQSKIFKLPNFYNAMYLK